ncbi:hypothetical protein BJX70DRAFT_394189 [Aspergillus crustosus]
MLSTLKQAGNFLFSAVVKDWLQRLPLIELVWPGAWPVEGRWCIGWKAKRKANSERPDTEEVPMTDLQSSVADLKELSTELKERQSALDKREDAVLIREAACTAREERLSMIESNRVGQEDLLTELKALSESMKAREDAMILVLKGLAPRERDMHHFKGKARRHLSL